MNSENSQRIITKLDLAWYTLFLYLEDISAHVQLLHDERLQMLFNELFQYVDDKQAVPEGDIEAVYVVLEQKKS